MRPRAERLPARVHRRRLVAPPVKHDVSIDIHSNAVGTGRCEGIRPLNLKSEAGRGIRRNGLRQQGVESNITPSRPSSSKTGSRFWPAAAPSYGHARSACPVAGESKTADGSVAPSANPEAAPAASSRSVRYRRSPPVGTKRHWLHSAHTAAPRRPTHSSVRRARSLGRTSASHNRRKVFCDLTAIGRSEFVITGKPE